MKKSHKRRLIVQDILYGIFYALCIVVSGIFLITGVFNLIQFDPGPSFCETNELEPPVITLNGNKTENIIVGNEYKEQGASVIHECEVLSAEINGSVDSQTVGKYEIVYSAADSRGQNSTVTRTVNVIPEYRGIIYLTFDDGPGPYTEHLLDILAKYDVKATFFITGSGDDATVLREFNEGHAIGLHSLTHNYSYIYSSPENYFDDLQAIQNRVISITGKSTNLMRFPGGSSNTVSRRYDGHQHIMSYLTKEVEARGFTYFDWDILSGDAGETTDTNEVIYRVTSALHEGENVVLQHDVKDFSVAAVEAIINYGIENRYTFKPLTSSSFNAHHGVNN